MKRVSKLVVFLLFVYAGLSFGVFFHSHPSGPQHTTKCQICQYSQIDQEQATVTEPVNQNSDLGVVGLETATPTHSEFAIQLCGRAPPLS
jgi:hypothetical protein